VHPPYTFGGHLAHLDPFLSIPAKHSRDRLVVRLRRWYSARRLRQISDFTSRILGNARAERSQHQRLFAAIKLPRCGGPVGPPATRNCEPRQARKGATVAVDACAGMWLSGPPPFQAMPLILQDLLPRWSPVVQRGGTTMPASMRPTARKTLPSSKTDKPSRPSKRSSPRSSSAPYLFRSRHGILYFRVVVPVRARKRRENVRYVARRDPVAGQTHM